MYTDKLFLKALVIMMVKHLSRIHELLCVLEQPTAEMRPLRLLLTENDKYLSRRTWERRLKGLTETLPGRIECLGAQLVGLIQPWAQGDGKAADRTTYSPLYPLHRMCGSSSIIRRSLLYSA